MVTALDQKQALMDSIRDGAIDFIVKPFDRAAGAEPAGTSWGRPHQDLDELAGVIGSAADSITTRLILDEAYRGDARPRDMDRRGIEPRRGCAS